MMSKLIVSLSILTLISLGCNHITLNGVPILPIEVCAQYLQPNDTVVHSYMFICNITTPTFQSFMKPDCTGDVITQFTLPINESWRCSVNDIEKDYHCSLAIYKEYYECPPSPSTSYRESVLIIDECGYNSDRNASVMFTCDDNGIYINFSYNDTEELCDHTVSDIHIQQGCDSETQRYYEITDCYKPMETAKPSPTPTQVQTTIQTKTLTMPLEILSETEMGAAAIIGIIVGVVVFIVFIFIGSIYCFLFIRNKKYTAVRTHKDDSHLESTNQKQTDLQSTAKEQLQPIDRQITNCKAEENVSLVLKKESFITEWLQQSAQIPEMDANKYAHIFITNGFDQSKLNEEITMDDLLTMGISDLAHRQLIIQALEPEGREFNETYI